VLQVTTWQGVSLPSRSLRRTQPCHTLLSCTYPAFPTVVWVRPGLHQSRPWSKTHRWSPTREHGAGTCRTHARGATCHRTWLPPCICLAM